MQPNVEPRHSGTWPLDGQRWNFETAMPDLATLMRTLGDAFDAYIDPVELARFNDGVVTIVVDWRQGTASFSRVPPPPKN